MNVSISNPVIKNRSTSGKIREDTWSNCWRGGSDRKGTALLDQVDITWKIIYFSLYLLGKLSKLLKPFQ
ncbi:unnamed protein product [Caenorhabditis brenneri]